MSLSEEFGRSLKLMMAGEKEYSEFVYEFICSVPGGLCVQIQEALEKYKRYEEMNVSVLDREDFFISGECVASSKDKYFFSIDMVDDSLTINKTSFEDGNVFEITLFGILKGRDIDYVRSEWLATVNTGEDVIFYSLVNNFLGQFVVSSKNGKLRSFKKIDVNEILLTQDLQELVEYRGFSRRRKRF